jgi:hypothetical protein
LAAMNMKPTIDEPLVSILIPTLNRRRYLPYALDSAVHQTYRNIEIFVINDGGADVSDIVRSFSDNRIVFLNRRENRGKAYSLNEALSQAKGKYVAYLDDDDLYYPHHIETLVKALESHPQYGAAYSDLYKTHCRIESDGSRTVLSKIVEVSRDFDRFFLLHFNHVLHMSLMHRRDLLAKTGRYSENLQILIDWDITRRLAFFTDFLHVPEITGEYYGPVGECDRISVQMRKDVSKYLANVLMIRTTRPPKPWPKMQDLSIIFLPEQYDEQTADTLKAIWLTTFYVFTLLLPIPQGSEELITVNMPNMKRVSVSAGATVTEKVDAALRQCDSDYVAIVPPSTKIKLSWVEDSLYAFVNSNCTNEGFELEGTTDDCLAAVFKKNELIRARTMFGHLSLQESVAAAGIMVRKPQLEELPFRFDDLLEQAHSAEQEGDWRRAAKWYEYIGANCQNTLWMNALAAKAWFKAGAYGKAAELIEEINQVRPSVDTLFLEAKIGQKRQDINSAIGLLQRARDILEGNELVWK